MSKVSRRGFLRGLGAVPIVGVATKIKIDEPNVEDKPTKRDNGWKPLEGTAFSSLPFDPPYKSWSWDD